jgi:hypothetical protein
VVLVRIEDADAGRILDGAQVVVQDVVVPPAEFVRGGGPSGREIG